MTSASWDDPPGTPAAGGPAGAGAPNAWDSIDTGWDQPVTSPASDSWGDAGAPVLAPRSATPAPTWLFAALGVAVVSVALGLTLGRASGPAALAGWFLAGIASVALVALHQDRDLRAALSVWYAPHPSAALLRVVTLACVVLGVAVNAWFFAQWIASR